MRAYIRAVYGLPADLQEDAAKKAGCSVIYRDHIDPDARANWIKSFGVSKDTAEPAWVYRLDVIALPKKRTGISPSADLTDALIALLGKTKLLVEHESGFTSQHSREFKERVKWARNYASRTQKVDVEQKRRAGRKGAQAAKLLSVVRLWKSGARKAEREIAGRIWRDPNFATWEDAAAELPAELKNLSHTSLWRIFGARDGVVRKRKVKRGRPRRSGS